MIYQDRDEHGRDPFDADYDDPAPTYKNAVCRGSWALGTACGKCERCIETRPAMTPSKKPLLPADPKTRKDAPMARGLLDYFPLACAAVAELSRIGNEQHNPGQPMHWNRAKSTDHADCIVRHLVDRGTVDSDGVRHATKVAWRALALLQTELEDAAFGPVEETNA